MAWRDLTDDPNAYEMVQSRGAAIRKAAADGHLNRVEVIRSYGSGKRVLDVGCVDHFAGTMEARPDWLHGIVVGIARECIGIDFESEGIAELRAAGFEVVEHDVTRGPGPLASMEPFDVVVAGELVEHLDTPRAIFDLGRDVLHPGGHLIVTTPNPYGQVRVRAGQLGLAWENLDHILYLPPTGAVELAERAGGLELVLYGTSEPVPLPVRDMWPVVKQWLRGGSKYRRRIDSVTPPEWALSKIRPSLLRGETMTYVFRRTEV